MSGATAIHWEPFNTGPSIDLSGCCGLLSWNILDDQTDRVSPTASFRQRAADHGGELGLAIGLGQQQHAGVEAALMHDRAVGIA